MFHPSTSGARLATSMLALILTPLALGLLSAGGAQWMTISARHLGVFFSSQLLGVGALQLIGLALLVGVVATGAWSSAGLLTAGVLGVGTLGLALYPPAMIPLIRALPSRLFAAGHGLSYGAALFVLLALGAMGLVLAWLRRRPVSPAPGVAVASYLGAPLVLAVSGLLLLYGIGEGQLRYLQLLDLRLNPLIILALFFGSALLIGGILLSRWAAGALILPAVFLLIANAVLFFAPHLLHPVVGGYAPMRVAHTLAVLGLMTTMAVIFLAFAALLLLVRRRRSRVVFPAEPPPPYGQAGTAQSPYASPCTPPINPYAPPSP